MTTIINLTNPKITTTGATYNLIEITNFSSLNNSKLVTLLNNALFVDAFHITRFPTESLNDFEFRITNTINYYL
jgi:hypothetical protein